ncbi:MAG: ABC transporter ATP-binding protein [Desulfobaccales bacterium]|nr:ABC transporter ATP-binding protein [Desulfobaccales bacterium]
MQTAILAQGIVKSFRERLWGPLKPVLREVDLEVGAGAIFGILGPNGAGKTTFISILAGLLLPDAGQAQVLGLDVVRQATLLRERINLAASGAHFLWCLTAEENLRFYGRLYGLGGRTLAARIEELLELFDLTSHRRVTFERLSTGLKQRLGLAKALINTPELLFLDEPTTGLDPEMAQHLREEILRLNRQTGLTILLTTHNLREAEMLCGEVAFLKEGRLLARGGLAELQQRLRLGDRISLIFPDSPAPLDYGRLPGVLSFKVQPGRVDLRVDRAEVRLAPILEAIAQTQKPVAEVHLQEVDLEEIYREITH